MSTISIIDYGMGNLCSVANAFRFWQTEVEFINTPEAIKKASRLVLPGVGFFRAAIETMTRLDLLPALHEAVIEEKKPILGICLGMQMMATIGSEGGETKGLGWIEGQVEPLVQEAHSSLSVPHIGFNYVQPLSCSDDPMLGDERLTRDYYFCHSYQLLAQDQRFITWKAHYGQDFIAAIQKENIWGTQFHPEKSQSNGLLFIKRFIDWRP